MYKDIINTIKPQLERTIDYLKSELSGLQVGRATPSLLENLDVVCYNNQHFPLKQLAVIQVPEPRTIIIRPWDKAIIKDIENAIRQSRLGLTPMPAEETIRLQVPSLSEERRRELVKILQEKTEECRISIRRHRSEIWEKIQEMEKNKEISEDDKFRAKDDLQKLVDDYNERIEELANKKEEEIMKV